jgi:hypothetical protein
MSYSSPSRYEQAIQALNGLQTNAETLQRIRRDRQKNVSNNLPRTTKYFERYGCKNKTIVYGLPGKLLVCIKQAVVMPASYLMSFIMLKG